MRQPILLVEDNEDDVFALKRAFRLEKIDNPLIVVGDGQSAVDYLAGGGEFADREKFPLPFMVFLDLKLPYRNGFDVLAWIRTQPELASMVVVILSSSDESVDRLKAQELGARSYLVKPPSPGHLRLFLTSAGRLPRKAEGGPVVMKIHGRPF